MNLENAMNSTQRQNDRTLKDELPRSVGAQYATGDQWRNISRKNEEGEESRWRRNRTGRSLSTNSSKEQQNGEQSLQNNF